MSDGKYMCNTVILSFYIQLAIDLPCFNTLILSLFIQLAINPPCPEIKQTGKCLGLPKTDKCQTDSECGHGKTINTS